MADVPAVRLCTYAASAEVEESREKSLENEREVISLLCESMVRVTVPSASDFEQSRTWILSPELKNNVVGNLATMWLISEPSYRTTEVFEAGWYRCMESLAARYSLDPAQELDTGENANERENKLESRSFLSSVGSISVKPSVTAMTSMPSGSRMDVCRIDCGRTFLTSRSRFANLSSARAVFDDAFPQWRGKNASRKRK